MRARRLGPRSSNSLRIKFPQESPVDKRHETHIRPQICLQTLPKELLRRGSQSPSLHHTYIQTHHEPGTLCGHTCANSCAQRPCVRDERQATNCASNSRSTFGIHSEHIRSTIGAHSEYGKTYHFVTFAFSKEETAYIILFNALTLKCWVLPYSECAPIVLRMYSECTPIVLRL